MANFQSASVNDRLGLLIREMQGLQVSLTNNNDEARSYRLVSKMAKNVNPGDLIEWPDGLGWAEIGGWSMVGDDVTLTGPGNRMALFKASERVRIQRRGE